VTYQDLLAPLFAWVVPGLVFAFSSWTKLFESAKVLVGLGRTRQWGLTGESRGSRNINVRAGAKAGTSSQLAASCQDSTPAIILIQFRVSLITCPWFEVGVPLSNDYRLCRNNLLYMADDIESASEGTTCC
jgi:hypothetical protein